MEMKFLHVPVFIDSHGKAKVLKNFQKCQAETKPCQIHRIANPIE